MVSRSAVSVEKDGSPQQTAVQTANTGGQWIGELLSAYAEKVVMGIRGAQGAPEQCDGVQPSQG